MKTAFATAIGASSQQYMVQRWKNGELTTTTDQLAEEVPVALVYNGVSHVVMLASPQDLEDFALGFSITEGILRDKSELYSIEVQLQENGIEVLVQEPHRRKPNIRVGGYGENFATGRRGAWTH